MLGSPSTAAAALLLQKQKTEGLWRLNCLNYTYVWSFEAKKKKVIRSLAQLFSRPCLLR